MLITPKRFGGEETFVSTWAVGTNAEVKAAIQAADDGKIDPTDYWAVGDERTVHLSAIESAGIYSQPEQDVVLVLMNVGYPGTGNEGVHFVWGQKDCLSKTGRMNPSDTNTGSWNGCSMRNFLNRYYFGALSISFRECLKQFNVITAKTYNGSTNQTSNDRISLFANKEVFGDAIISNSTEAAALSQIEYYKTAANRIKQVNGEYNYWWERSPSVSEYGFCTVTSRGAYSSSTIASDDGGGIAPFGCI